VLIAFLYLRFKVFPISSKEDELTEEWRKLNEANRTRHLILFITIIIFTGKTALFDP
jgi:hypothetical protein